jgi:catechol 2,3-dioxygenase-like lactoylglutathione lyase family enzyme
MPEAIGLDHIYISVTDLTRSEHFYDMVMGVLEFRKNDFVINAERHVQYYNRHFGYVLRPAHRLSAGHDPYAPGLHHLCFRVTDRADIQVAWTKLNAMGISVGEPRHFPEYAPDYYAIFLADPDGIKLEITNYRQERRERYDKWSDLDSENLIKP